MSRDEKQRRRDRYNRKRHHKNKEKFKTFKGNGKRLDYDQEIPEYEDWEVRPENFFTDEDNFYLDTYLDTCYDNEDE